jgi:hypothetical protein
MTPARKNGLGWLLGIIAVPTVSGFFSLGAARSELSFKEDRITHDSTLNLLRRDHERDIRAVSDSVLAERTRRDLQQVRDSAQMATILARTTEVACDQNPRRRYCGR